MLKNCHIKLIFRFPGSPVADNLLIGAAHRRIIRITKADGCVLSQSVVKCSAKHPGLAIIFFGSFCLLLFPGLYIYDDGVSFHGIAVNLVWFFATCLAHFMSDGLSFNFGF